MAWRAARPRGRIPQHWERHGGGERGQATATQAACGFLPPFQKQSPEQGKGSAGSAGSVPLSSIWVYREHHVAPARARDRPRNSLARFRVFSLAQSSAASFVRESSADPSSPDAARIHYPPSLIPPTLPYPTLSYATLLLDSLSAHAAHAALTTSAAAATQPCHELTRPSPSHRPRHRHRHQPSTDFTPTPTHRPSQPKPSVVLGARADSPALSA